MAIMNGTSIVTITPDLAKKWLENNTANRAFRKGILKKYEEELQAGRWQLNGEAIKFAVDGTLLDGQHRLQACVNSGVSFSSYVVRNLPKEVFETLDNGAVRKSADLLSIEGAKNTTLLASMCSWIQTYKKAVMTGSWDASMSADRHAVIEFYREEPHISEAATVASNHRTPLIQASILGAIHHLVPYKKDSEQWIAAIASGSNLQSCPQAIQFLREWLINDRLKRIKSNREFVSAFTVKSWNAARENRPVKLFKYCDERFPELNTK